MTQVNKLVEAYTRDQIIENFGSHDVLGEESDSDGINLFSKNLWVIDPIDGTAIFVKQGKDYCVLISYFSEGMSMQSIIYAMFSIIDYIVQ